MIKKKQDTRKMIIDALVQLIQEKDYSKISITEICSTAQVVRRTFYRYYKSREDVMSEYISNLCREFVEECISLPNDVSSYSIMYMFFMFWEQHRDIFNILIENNLSNIVMRDYKEFMFIINNRFFSEMQANFGEKDTEYYSLFLLGGMWNMLSRWLADDSCKDKPGDMANRALNVLRYHLISDN